MVFRGNNCTGFFVAVTDFRLGTTFLTSELILDLGALTSVLSVVVFVVSGASVLSERFFTLKGLGVVVE